MENRKRKFWEISKLNGYKKNFLTLIQIFFQVHPRNSKKIIEAEPSKWLQSKDPWKSEWIRHLTKDSDGILRREHYKRVKNKRNNA